MRKFALPLVLLTAACGAEEVEPVSRAWSWDAPAGEQVTSVALLHSGETFVGLTGTTPQGVFLSPDGKELHTVDIAPLCDECGLVVPAKPLLLAEHALMGSTAAGGPLLRVEPGSRTIRHMPLQNPRGLPSGEIVVDGRYGAAFNGSEALVPGSAIVQLSVEGILTATHPTGPVRAVAHVKDDVYAYLQPAGILSTWRSSDNAIEVGTATATRLAGSAPLTVAALVDGGTLRLHGVGDGFRPIGPLFAHDVELAVASSAGRIAVGVTETALEAPPPDPEGEEPDAADAPAPRTVLVLDEAGKTVGSFEAPAPIRGLDISGDGEWLFIAHERGVTALNVR